MVEYPEQIPGNIIDLKDHNGNISKVTVGKCPFRSITTKANGVTAVRCIATGAVAEASLFETCHNISLDYDDCSKSK